MCELQHRHLFLPETDWIDFFENHQQSYCNEDLQVPFFLAVLQEYDIDLGISIQEELNNTPLAEDLVNQRLDYVNISSGALEDTANQSFDNTKFQLGHWLIKPQNAHLLAQMGISQCTNK